MRVAASRASRVGPGDRVSIQARLLPPSKLGRLFVFAKEAWSDEYSPYVMVPTIHYGEPKMLPGMSLRLTEALPERQLSFEADFDGYVKVMQEVDRPGDPTAKVAVKVKVDPSLPWKSRLVRKLSGMAPWNLIQ